MVNRWSTGCQPVVNRGFCSSIGLHRISFVRACEETFRTVVYDTLGARGTFGFMANRPVGIMFCLFCRAPPRLAAARCAVPTRTARGMFGFWTRQVRITLNALLRSGPGIRLPSDTSRGPSASRCLSLMKPSRIRAACFSIRSLHSIRETSSRSV